MSLVTIASDRDVPDRDVEARPGAHPVDLTGIAIVALCLAPLLVARYPSAFGSWTPVMTVGLVPVPLGLTVLARSARADVAARVALALLAWGLLSGLLSGAPYVSIVGAFGRGESALIWAMALAFWALGRQLGRASLLLVGRVFLIVAAVHAVFVVLQAIVDGSGLLAQPGGRSLGLATSPLNAAAIIAAAAAYLSHRAVDLPRPAVWVGLFVAGMALIPTGSRGAVLAGTVLVVAGAAMERRPIALARPAVFLAGATLGSLLASPVAVDRFGEAAGDGRFEAWRYGWSAFWDRPVQGWGLGRVRVGLQSRFTDEFLAATNLGDDVTHGWSDVHNIVVQYAVAVGAVGLALLVALVVLAGRSARGPLAAAVLAIVGFWLLQPVNVLLLPTTLFLFGAAEAWGRYRGECSVDEGEPASSLPVAPSNAAGEEPAEPIEAPIESRSSGLVEIVALAVGLVLGASVFLIDQRIDSAVQRADYRSVGRVASLLPNDPVLADTEASAVLAGASSIAEARDPLTSAVRRATTNEPDFPTWWARRAQAELVLGDIEAMGASLDEALSLQPTNPYAWRLMVSYARQTGDAELERHALDMVCRLGSTACSDPAASPRP